jgi:hypothetical protein
MTCSLCKKKKTPYLLRFPVLCLHYSPTVPQHYYTISSVMLSHTTSHPCCFLSGTALSQYFIYCLSLGDPKYDCLFGLLFRCFTLLYFTFLFSLLLLFTLQRCSLFWLCRYSIIVVRFHCHILCVCMCVVFCSFSYVKLEK